MAYYITQPLGVGAGADDEALDGAWIDKEIEIHAADGGVGATYLHTLLDKPDDSSAVLTNATAQVATITPDVTGTLRVRTRTTTSAGVVSYKTRVIRVTQDATGADVGNGVCPTAFGELPGESNYDGNARGYVERHERNWRAVQALVSSSVTLSDDTPQAPSGAGDPGVSTEVSRADHVHPDTGGVSLGAGTPAPVGTVGAAGVSTDAAPFDHVHAVGDTIELIGASASLKALASHGGAPVPLSCDVDGLVVTSSSPIELLSGTFSVADAAGAYGCTVTHAAAKTLVHANTCTSVTRSIAQAASGAGGTLRDRAGQGASGQIGGQCYIGGGNGGTPGTNLGGDTHVVLGTPVGGVTAKLILEREDGTGIAHLYEGAAGKAYVVTAGTAMLVGRGATTGATFDASGITLRDSLLTAFVPTTKHVASSGYEYLWTAGGVSTVSVATTTNVLTLPVQASQGLRLRVTVSVYNLTASTHTVVETTTPWIGRRAGSGALAETVNFVAAAAVGDADAGLGTVDVAASSNNVVVSVVTTDTNQRRVVAFAEVLPANNP